MEKVENCETLYEIVQEGEGDATVVKASTVTVHAKGVVKENDYKFWSTRDPGQQPFTYQAGIGGVIKGWDMGCLGMKKGEIRKLEIPSHEGYGDSGFPAWKIPPKATLVFEIEVLKIH
ncbi:Peptidyl-prolyl cis-trans isomerase [Hondaea fermentalgiana]|uniref:peptidylprolyl isomerase n=1 Tax=Hondaea fermentalgiana TaxID=2315210 RepID=A0A2R5GQA0_9STRA|nr:Peptidyl-prolyl cis-trans isomerase [Hondaea fermentalgiana]|eukprot:GBG30803.1 Peptidyl-prolyl cis-trans isomerase [Hondaea fermentalgiana]